MHPLKQSNASHSFLATIFERVKSKFNHLGKNSSTNLVNSNSLVLFALGEKLNKSSPFSLGLNAKDKKSTTKSLILAQDER